jgi:hypothetical protein
MEGVNASTVSFDVSMTAINGAITFLKSGIYEITWNAEGQLTAPYPAIVPSWSVGLTLDNVLVQGSVFGAFLVSPDDILSATGNTVIVAVNAGQVLKLINTATNPIDLVSTAFGSSVANTACSLSISLEAAL